MAWRGRLRAREVFAVLVLGGALASSPVRAAVVSFDSGPYGSGDNAFFDVSEITTDDPFQLVFQVSAPVSVSVVNGFEGAGSFQHDMSNLLVALTGSVSDPAVGNVDYFSLPFGSRGVDGFNAEWLLLVPGQNYTLTVSFDLDANSVADTFTGQMSFAQAPIPPAVALFGSGLVGLVLLSRRKRKHPSAKPTARAGSE